MAFKFSSIQSLGRALMLPIAMLPVAGLLLRFGQPDLLNIVAVADAGNAIFANLPLLFAIGVAVGFAKDNHGAAGLAGAVGFLILTAMLKNINKDIDTGVLGGILIGSVAGLMYNKYKDIKLPEFLAFFGGKRFIPIITGVLAVLLGAILGIIWPPIQTGLHDFSLWMSESGGIGLFLYGFLNRVLLVTGLHHVLNSLFWFQLGNFTNTQGVVVHGDIARFMAGDPTAGYFMAGYFPIMMFGLPAICLAMYTTAFKENRKEVAGLLLSMALTSFLTGVTEPIEYSFVFLAPVLYVIHAVLTGVSMALMYYLHVHLGFSFSAGAIDYVLFYKLATNPLFALVIGAIMFVLYYLLAVFFIRKFNLQTIGRESIEEKNALKQIEVSADSIEMQYINALGGRANLKSIDACTTRLRLIVIDSAKVNKATLKALGAKGIVTPTPESVQVILGPQAEIVASAMRETIASMGETHTLASPQPVITEHVSQMPKVENAESNFQCNSILEALGGQGNIRSLGLVALTRVRVDVKSLSQVDKSKLKDNGVLEVIPVSSNILQLYIGTKAGSLSEGLKILLK